MRVLASVLLSVASAFAYEVTFPGTGQSWNTSGPNYLEWDRVSTDPLNFTAVLSNVNSTTDQVLNNLVDGTAAIALCSPPSGGWPSGSGFRVNLVQDAQHLSTILAQSTEFDIIAVPSSSSASSSATSAASAQTSSASGSSTSSSATSTKPSSVSAASLDADARVGLLTAIAALTAFFTALF